LSSWARPRRWRRCFSESSGADGGGASGVADRSGARFFLGLVGVPPARTRFGLYRLLPAGRSVANRPGRERRAGMRFWFMPPL
jgi:hypothetical protein